MENKEQILFDEAVNILYDTYTWDYGTYTYQYDDRDSNDHTDFDFRLCFRKFIGQ